MSDEEGGKQIHRELIEPDAPGPTQMARIWSERRSSGMMVAGCDLTVHWENRESAQKEIPRTIRKLIDNLEREREEAIQDNYERTMASEPKAGESIPDPLDDNDEDDEKESQASQPTDRPFRRG